MGTPPVIVAGRSPASLPIMLLLVGIVAGAAGHAYLTRPTAEQKVIRRSADSLQTSGRALDSTIARHQSGDSAAVAEPLQAVRVHQSKAASLGDVVPRLQHTTDSAIAAAAVSDSARAHAMEALHQERETANAQADELRQALGAQQRALFVLMGQVAFYRDTALVQMQGQRDKAQQLLNQALSLKHRRCGPGVTVGGGYGLRGPDAGVFIGLSCTL